MNKELRLLSLLCPLSLAFVSCRGLGNLTGNEFAKPQSKMDWILRPDLDPPTSASPTVWLRFKNASSTDLDLQPQLREAVQQQGYALVANAAEADYQLVATLQHFDKAASFDGGESAIQTVGKLAPIAGLAGGVLAGDTAGEKVGFGILGGVAGSIGSAMIENFSKVAEWDLVIDFQVNERIEGGFREETSSKSTAQASTEGGVRAGRRVETGGNDSRQERKSDVTREKTHLRNQGRLVAVAYQMTMSRDEALAEMLPKLPRVVAAALP